MAGLDDCSTIRIMATVSISKIPRYLIYVAVLTAFGTGANSAYAMGRPSGAGKGKSKGVQCGGGQTRTTVYAASCKKDPNGGGSGSAGNCGNPADHAGKNDNGKLAADSDWVMAAIPQSGGPPGLRLGCNFKIKQYPNVVFKACDTYGKGSNGKNKVDISVKCEELVTGGSHPAVEDCGDIDPTSIKCSDAYLPTASSNSAFDKALNSRMPAGSLPTDYRSKRGARTGR